MKRLLIVFFIILCFAGCGSKEKDAEKDKSSIPSLFVIILVTSVAINVYFIAMNKEKSKNKEEEQKQIKLEIDNKEQIIEEIKDKFENLKEQEYKRMDYCLNKFNEDINNKLDVFEKNIINKMTDVLSDNLQTYKLTETHQQNQVVYPKVMYATLNNNILYSQENKENSSQFKLIQTSEDKVEFELIIDNKRQQDIISGCDINGVDEGKGYFTAKLGIAIKDGINKWKIKEKTLIKYKNE
jgi:hypothetical protein